MKDERNKTSKFSIFILWFYRVGISVLALSSITLGIYKGIKSGSTPNLLAWIIAGFFGALVIVITPLATNLGIKIWDKAISWLSERIRRYPDLRFWITFPGIIFSLIGAFLVLKYSGMDWSLRILIGSYLVFILPATILSFFLDDWRNVHKRLSKQISREMQIQNPQAAIEHAFTIFEDHLRKRFPDGTNLYGTQLIKAAYDGDKSKFTYSYADKDRTNNLYNLMTGSYSLLRNPRHHKIIEDDERETQAIISLIDLLMGFVDSSEEREIKVNDEADTG